MSPFAGSANFGRSCTPIELGLDRCAKPLGTQGMLTLKMEPNAAEVIGR
ncbi:hypothetical protein DYST_00593 [Dyella terrae]|nr:hypothetical protein DYST_00593 [Dyella terrae]